MEATINNKVFTLDELAEILTISKRSLYRFIKNGRLKGVRIGKAWRVTQAQLDDFLESCKVE